MFDDFDQEEAADAADLLIHKMVALVRVLAWTAVFVGVVYAAVTFL